MGDSPGRRPLVAFDFDGTLTTRDSFTAFLAWRVSRIAYLVGLASLIPAGLGYVADWDRGRIKAASVRTFLRGLERSDLAAEAEAFAQASRLFRPDAVETWNDWKARGAEVVIVTASPSILVAPFARRLGADGLIGTELAFDARDRVTGAFDGENCRGEEKVRRLREAYGDDIRLAAAYGDTAGDAQMLQIAEVRGYRVFHGSP